VLVCFLCKNGPATSSVQFGLVRPISVQFKIRDIGEARRVAPQELGVNKLPVADAEPSGGPDPVPVAVELLEARVVVVLEMDVTGGVQVKAAQTAEMAGATPAPPKRTRTGRSVCARAGDRTPSRVSRQGRKVADGARRRARGLPDDWPLSSRGSRQPGR